MNIFHTARILTLDNELQQEVVDGWLAGLGLPWQAAANLAELQAACAESLPAMLLVPFDDLGKVLCWLSGAGRGQLALLRIPVVVWGGHEVRTSALAAGADLVVDERASQGERESLRVLYQAQVTPPRIGIDSVTPAIAARVGRALMKLGINLVEPRSLPDLMLVVDHQDTFASLDRLHAVRQSRGPSGSLLLLSAHAAPWLELQARLAGGDGVIDARASRRSVVRGLWHWWERQLRGAGVRSLPAASASSGALRRGDFLALLDHRFRQGPAPWEVLMSIRLDQAEDLEGLEFGNAFELERLLIERVGSQLRDTDAWTTWLEYGLGALIRRESREEVIQQAEAVLKAIADTPFLLRGRSLQATASIGLALAPVSGASVDPDRWFAAAHAAQAIAHRLGGNRHDGVLDQTNRSLPDERQLIVREWVKEAAKGRRIRVEFQPILPIGEQGLDGLYLLRSKLHDPRAPLGGILRHEFIQFARAAGTQQVIDHLSLFNAFEALAELALREQPARIMVPLDLPSFDDSLQRWLEKELSRRGRITEHLVLELDAESMANDAELRRRLAVLTRLPLQLGLQDDSGSLARLARFDAAAFSYLRLPVASVAGLQRQALNSFLGGWRRPGCALILDQLDSPAQLASLRELGVDYVMGEGLVAAGPRPDYDFLYVAS